MFGQLVSQLRLTSLFGSLHVAGVEWLLPTSLGKGRCLGHLVSTVASLDFAVVLLVIPWAAQIASGSSGRASFSESWSGVFCLPGIPRFGSLFV